MLGLTKKWGLISPSVHGDVMDSLAMKFKVLGHCTIIIVIKLITIYILFVNVFVKKTENTDSLSDNILYPYLTSKGTIPLRKDRSCSMEVIFH